MANGIQERPVSPSWAILTGQYGLSTPEVWAQFGDDYVDKLGPDGVGYRER
jgi:hypothetical protein